MGFKVKFFGKRPSQDRKMLRKMKRDLPKIIAKKALNHFKYGFVREGGQTDDSLGGWRPRRNNPYDKRKGHRRTLVKSGDLKRDVQIRSTNFDKIAIGTSSDTAHYASVHNEGKGNMPKREFLGPSLKLDKKVIREINRYLNNKLK